MAWGVTAWGLTSWGDAVLGLDAPVLNPDFSPAEFDVQGGTLITLLGANFYPQLTAELLTGFGGGPYTVVGVGYQHDPDFDLTPVRAIVGMPALDAGTYSIRVRTPSGESNVLQDVIVYKPFAEATYTLKARESFSAKWRVGRRLRA